MDTIIREDGIPVPIDPRLLTGRRYAEDSPPALGTSLDSAAAHPSEVQGDVGGLEGGQGASEPPREGSDASEFDDDPAVAAALDALTVRVRAAHDELDEQEQDPFSLEPAGLTRLLQARELDVDAAFSMWEEWRQWRREYGVRDGIDEESVLREIESGKAFWHGRDNQGHPCVVIFPRHHHPDKRDIDEVVKFCVYMMEKGVKLADLSGCERFTCIYDRAGWTAGRFDRGLFALARQLAGILQANYAERLHRLHILNVNWFFWSLFKIVSPFLSAKTRAKIHIVRDVEELKDEFGAADLLPEHGGTSPYTHPFPRQPDDES